MDAANIGPLLAPLHARALAAPGHVALHAAGRAIGYGKLWSRIERVAAHLVLDWQVRKGDRVATLCLNHDLQLALLFACARIGAVFVPLNYRLATPELAAIAADARVRAVFHDEAHEAVAAEVAAMASMASMAADFGEPGDCPHPRPLSRLAGEGRAPWADGAPPPVCSPLPQAGEGQGVRAVAANARPAMPASAPTIPHAHIDRLIDRPAAWPPEPGPMAEDTPVLLVYTSGTTGQPKGALHTQGGLLANARASWWAHDMTVSDHVLSTLPLFHVGGLCIQTVPALLAGATVTLHDRFSADGWLDAVEQHRPTLSLMVPATMRAVLEHPRWARADLTSLRGVMAGSSTIPLSYIEAFHARGVPLGQVYGATETGPVSIVLRLHEAMARPGQAGWPQPECEARLVGRDGEEVDVGEVGEIWLRAPNLMRGYWGAPPGDARSQPWFRSGDLARRDADGCITVVGRNKDMIISGGENIYPAEIENALIALPGVAECAVVGLAHPRWGEVPVAAIVPAPGAAPETLSLEAVRDALDGRIARFKLPHGVVLLPSLPRSALGKVQKPQLIAMLAALGTAPAPASG